MMIRAVALDAFGTPISYSGRRSNPYLRLLAALGDKPSMLRVASRMAAVLEIRSAAPDGKQVEIPNFTAPHLTANPRHGPEGMAS